MLIPGHLENIMKQQNPINIRLIDHVVIRVKNLEQMIDFYSDVLGCRLERGPGEGRLAQLRAGSSLIDLVDATGALGRRDGSAKGNVVTSRGKLIPRLFV